MKGKSLAIGLALGVGGLILAVSRKGKAATMQRVKAPLKLSDHFDLLEFVDQHPGLSDYGLTGEELINVKRLVTLVLEPLRLKYGPIKINSGGRPPTWRDSKGRTINEILVQEGYNPAKSSDHEDFAAADIRLDDQAKYPLAMRDAIANKDVRQAILYRRDGKYTHMHVAVTSPNKVRFGTNKLALLNDNGNLSQVVV